MNDTTPLVCFRFLAVIDLHVPQFDIAIPLKHLEAFPDSLLSKRCEWANASTAAATAAAEQTTAHHNAILVHPSNDPYKKDWWHEMGQLIVDAYDFLFHKNGTEGSGSGSGSAQEEAVVPPCRLKLPADMELDVALMVLDYYGLTIEKPRSEISLENSIDLIQIRAALFFVQMDLVHNMKDFVVETLKKSPRRIIYFVHLHPHVDSIEVIQNTTIKHTFMQLGNETNFRDFKEVLEEEPMRRHLVTVLGDVGLKANFIKGNELLNSCYIPNDDIPNHVLSRFMESHYMDSLELTTTEKCWLATSKVRNDPDFMGSEMKMLGSKYELEERHVLCVEITKSSSESNKTSGLSGSIKRTRL